MRVAQPQSRELPLVGGLKPLCLRRDASTRDVPEFIEATLLPGRGMNIFQVRALFPYLGEINLLHSPPVDEAARQLNGGADDFMGVASFRFGGALLVPFANRIRGRLLPDARTLETDILGHRVHLPADWRGNHPGAEQCAIHGLMLASKMAVNQATDDHVVATLDAGDFGGYWLSCSHIRVEVNLTADAIEMAVTVKNTGHDLLPVGIGWHPYFALPSGRRDQARLHLPARQRALVNNYDDVFPTGALESVAGTPYDFTAPEGAPLGSRYFDDMFVDLEGTADGRTRVEILDPAARYGIRLTALSPHVSALQVYSRPDQPFIVVEPQFNWADPFSRVWPQAVNTGMVRLAAGAEVTWAVHWQLFVV